MPSAGESLQSYLAPGARTKVSRFGWLTLLVNSNAIEGMLRDIFGNVKRYLSPGTIHHLGQNFVLLFSTSGSWLVNMLVNMSVHFL